MRRRLLGKFLKTVPSWNCNWSVTREVLYKGKKKSVKKCCVCLYHCKNTSFLEREQYVRTVTPAAAADCRTGTVADVWNLSIWCWWETSPPQPIPLSRLAECCWHSPEGSSSVFAMFLLPLISDQRFWAIFSLLQKSGDLTVFIGFLLPLRS